MRTEFIEECLRVAQAQSITRAAKSLYLSQSVLSSHIGALEKDLGFKVFERASGAHVTLTSAGMAFLESAQAAINMLDVAKDRALAIAQSPQALRMSLLGGKWNLNPNAARLLETIAGITVDLVNTDDSPSAFDPLIEGLADILFMPDFSHTEELVALAEAKGIAYLSLTSEKISIAMMDDNPLARKRPLFREDLAGAVQLIGPASMFPLIGDAVAHVFGKEIPISMKWAPSSMTPQGVRNYDMGTALVFGNAEQLRLYYRDRPDVVVIDELADGPVFYETGMAYRAADYDERYELVANTLKSQGGAPFASEEKR